jgi:hypothetical protein
VTALERRLDAIGANRRYSLGGRLAWIAWPAAQPLSALDALLADIGSPGLVLSAPCHEVGRTPLLGYRAGLEFARRVRLAIDPHDRFLEV